MRGHRRVSVSASAFLVAALVVAMPGIGNAAPNPALHYPAITKDSGDPKKATATFPQPPTTPLTATVTSTKNIALGSSSTLPDTVGFGSVFGSSKGFSYFSVTTVKGETAGTRMTIEFDTVVPARSFGIALGDLDGEKATITMSNGSTPLTSPEMGVQPAYNSGTGQPANLRVVESNLTPGDSNTAPTVVIDDKVCADGFTSTTCNTNNVVIWLWPEADVTTIQITTVSQTPLTNAFYQLWLAYTASQVVNWRPNTAEVTLDGTTTITPTAATVVLPPAPEDAGDITYTVNPSSTSNCTVNSVTGAITASTAGTCVVTATAAATDDWGAGSATQTFTFVNPPPPPPAPPKPPTPTEWSPQTTTFQVNTFPGVINLPPPPNPPGGGSYTFSTHSNSTSLCTSDRDTPTVTVQQPGTCIVTATIGETKNFARASVTVEFTIIGGPMLAATGAPAWPLWPALAGLVGVAMLVASRVLYRPQHRS